MDQVPPFQRICVFCGSGGGEKPIYTQVAEHLGNELVKRGIDLVYGGGSIGLMGTVAQAVQDAGGHVTGVIPKALMPKEVCGKTVGDLVAVDDMHQRKAEMASRADAFIALPGGFGTFEEVLEIITWAQLGIHKKPVGLLNVDGYYDSMLSMFDKALKEGFLNQASHNIVVFAPTAAELLDKLKSYTPLVDISVPELQWATVTGGPVKRQHNGSSGTASPARRASTLAASSASGARAFRALPEIVGLATTGGRCALVDDVRGSGLLYRFQPPHARQCNVRGKMASICGATGVSTAAVAVRRLV